MAGNIVKVRTNKQDNNQGRKNDLVIGIKGDRDGGVTFDSMRRYLRLHGKCKAVNYTGGAGLATTRVTGAGNNDLTLTLTTNGAGDPATVAIVAGGTGYVTGDKVTITDATGTGIRVTVTAGGGVVNAVVIDNLNTDAVADATPMNPATFFLSFLLKVATKAMRNIAPAHMLRVLHAAGQYTQLGALPIEFAESNRNFLGVNDSTAYDVLSGEKMELIYKINPLVRKPSFTMNQEWDTNRRAIQNGKTSTILLNPIKQRETNLVLAVGDNTFNASDLALGDEPLLRMWLLGATPGNITAIELEADGDMKLSGTVAEVNQMLEDLGFNFGRPDYINASWATSNALKAAYNQPTFFDTGFVSDVDGRPGSRLLYNKIRLKITSAVAQNCAVVIETLPGSYK